jgi:hypothetical protein
MDFDAADDLAVMEILGEQSRRAEFCGGGDDEIQNAAAMSPGVDVTLHAAYVPTTRRAASRGIDCSSLRVTVT